MSRRWRIALLSAAAVLVCCGLPATVFAVSTGGGPAPVPTVTASSTPLFTPSDLPPMPASAAPASTAPVAGPVAPIDPPAPAVPAPVPVQPSPRQGVHAGAFCSSAGQLGYTVDGTLMRCSATEQDHRLRWRRA